MAKAKEYVLLLSALAFSLMLFGCTDILSPRSIGSSDSETYALSKQAGYGTAASSPTFARTTYGSQSPVNIPPELLDSSGRMLVKTATMEVEVEAGKLAEKTAQLERLANENKGYVYSKNYYESGGRKYYRLTIKLPPASFESFPELVKQLGTLKSMSTDTQDITNQYIDVVARLNNKEAQRERLLQLYNKTEKVEEILQIENELVRLQYEIDSLTGQKIQMERQATLSTLDVTLYEESPVVDRTLLIPLSGLGGIFVGALNVALILLVGIIGFAIPFTVLGGVLIVVYVLLRAVWHRFRKKNAKA
ncbi:MAG: DUF4349 domain-containing protein [Candidatus Micrarchaeia archaeon]